MFPVHFSHRSAPRVLSAGESFVTPRTDGFRDAPASELRSIVSEIEKGRPWHSVVSARFASTKPWLHRIVSSPLRTQFIEKLLPDSPGLTLDIGAGWGQIARPLAATRPVVALEPVAERLAFIRASALQDQVAHNMAFLETDYFDVAFSSRFSAICAIGVLEWIGSFQSECDPQMRQQAFLRKVRSELAPGGAFVIGIENRLGLKYLLGCPDDHIGVPNIACLPAPLARQRRLATSGHPLTSFTYSDIELEQLLRVAGFSSIEFFAALPDYKLPVEILSLEDGARRFNTWLATASIPAEHNGYDGSPVAPEFQETLEAHYRSFAAAGIAHHFAPSFFVRAS